MAVLCGMHTIQYSARSVRLSMHKLFTSCIRRCLVSCAYDRVMLALSAVILIYIFQFRPAFLPRRSARRHSGILGLAIIRYRTSPKIWGGFLYEEYSPENDSEFILAVKIETRHPSGKSFGSEFLAICNHCGVMAARSRKTLKILEKFLRFFGKTTPHGIIFKILFWKFLSRQQPTCFVQMSWNLADEKSVKSCVAYLTKHNLDGRGRCSGMG